jgi:hypothetical protein
VDYGLDKLSGEKSGIAAFPNPFSTSVFFEFRNAKSEMRDVQAAIYDIQGKLVQEFKKRGSHSALRSSSYAWPAKNQPNGTYIIKAYIDNREYTRSVTLIR